MHNVHPGIGVVMPNIPAHPTIIHIYLIITTARRRITTVSLPLFHHRLLPPSRQRITPFNQQAGANQPNLMLTR
ncbi:hypothetical protein C8J56DRAFT_1058041 [Mycena floridula]|nr:hypothetical protein C8J56DRAFT_1058041 [Mycena floridula]